MSSRQALDAKASSMMLILCVFWGLQQVVLKVAAADISPLMQLALRSGLSAVMVLPLLLLARNTQWASTEYLPAGILVGILFAAEFFMLGQAIQYTSASHVVVLLYTAPIFVALALHWKLPAERLSRLQWGGILLSFAGIAVTFLCRDTVQQESHQNFSQMLFGDLLALSAGILWAATTVAVRLSRLSEAPATQTLFYQLMGGFLILLPMAWWMGQAEIHWTALAIGSLIFHAVLISFISYLAWFWLLKQYLASSLGVFSFLTPLFGVLFGVWLLNESLSQSFMIGAVLVMLGVLMVNAQCWFKHKTQVLKRK